MNLSNYLRFGSKESSMRLYGFIAMMCIVFTACDAGTCAILGIVLGRDLDKVAMIIGALAGVIGTLSTIVLWNAVQKFAEKGKIIENKEEEIKQ